MHIPYFAYLDTVEELHTSDWRLIGSQTYKLQETNQLIKRANSPLYIHCCGYGEVQVLFINQE